MRTDFSIFLTASLMGGLCLVSADAIALGSARECAKTAQDGQVWRDEGSLIAARAAFIRCARDECPAFIRKDCALWQAEVEARLPSVILSAQDGSGVLLGDVTVTADGQPFANHLSGEPHPMDPGQHTFSFEQSGGAHASVAVTLTEGEKSRRISAVLVTSPTPAAASPRVTTTTQDRGPRSRAFVSTGLIVGGLGIVGLGVGTFFGAMAISDKANAHCDSNNFCENGGPLGALKPDSTKATIGLVAGGVLLAGSAALVWFAPRSASSQPSAVTLTPLVGAGRAGVSLGGTF